MNIIHKSIPMMKTNFQETLELSNLQGFQDLQLQFEEKCKESQENQEQLHSLLSTFSLLNFSKYLNILFLSITINES